MQKKLYLCTQRYDSPILIITPFTACNMSEQEHKAMINRIVYGLQVAERVMLEEKARRGESIIVCDAKGEIRSVPATEYLP
jgi:hypothetical protein